MERNQQERNFSWQKLEKIFHNVLARPVEEREAFLTEACDCNLALRQEVESLILSYEAAQGEAFLDFSLLQKRRF